MAGISLAPGRLNPGEVFVECGLLRHGLVETQMGSGGIDV